MIDLTQLKCRKYLLQRYFEMSNVTGGIIGIRILIRIKTLIPQEIHVSNFYFLLLEQKKYSKRQCTRELDLTKFQKEFVCSVSQTHAILTDTKIVL